MQARRDNSSGSILFSGMVPKDHTKQFKGHDIWMSLGAPGNIRLTVQGRHVTIKSDVGPWNVEVVKGRVVQGANLQG